MKTYYRKAKNKENNKHLTVTVTQYGPLHIFLVWKYPSQVRMIFSILFASPFIHHAFYNINFLRSTNGLN